MPFKSIFRAVGALFAPRASRMPPHPIDRLTGRSDWGSGEFMPLPIPGSADPQPIVTDGPDMIPPELRGGTDIAGKSDPWPVTDDPYAKPEPCTVVPDAGKYVIDKLSERGLTGAIRDKSALSEILQLIERQEDAELHLRKIGMTWERGRGWYMP